MTWEWMNNFMGVPGRQLAFVAMIYILGWEIPHAGKWDMLRF